MSDITELERRITAALDRIGTGIDGLGSGDSSALQTALDEEKMANAQLEERVRSLKDQHEAKVAEIETGLADRLAKLTADLEAARNEAGEAKSQNRALRQSNQRLQASLHSLREASANAVEPHMINQAMMSELEGLRAARSADRAEVEEILGALEPLLKEDAPHA